jgi:cytochrome c biogenesis protein CcmG/thiol:disulfide interchange protein DsbE
MRNPSKPCSLGLVPFCLAASLVWLVAPHGLSQSEKPSVSTQSKQAALDPPIVTLEGYKAVLAKYRGKPVVVNFWATWCEPCRYEYPMIVELAKEYGPKGLVVVGVTFDDDSDRNVVRHFLERTHPSFPNFRLKPGTDSEFIRGVNPAWNGTIPTTEFYARDGQIVGQFIGTRPREDWDKAIQQLLQAPAKTPAPAAHHPK